MAERKVLGAIPERTRLYASPQDGPSKVCLPVLIVDERDHVPQPDVVHLTIGHRRTETSLQEDACRQAGLIRRNRDIGVGRDERL